MNQKVMQRLIWKDARTLAPLMIATLAAIVVCNLLLYFFTPGATNTEGQLRLGLSRIVWILLPNLLAFGAPAILVGGEEESGSLAWLRTLPASWRGIALSKLAITAGAMSLAWAVGSVLYWLQWKISPGSLVTWAENTGNVPDWSFLAISAQLIFSVALMLTSFFMAYWFRSPINALLAVVPVMTILTVGIVNAEEYLLYTIGGQPRWQLISSIQLVLLCGLPVGGAVLALYGLHQWVAKRRLTGPEANLVQRIEQSVAAEAFRPPRSTPATWYGVSLTNRRPGMTRALLWQSTRQNFGTLFLLTVVASVGVLIATWAKSNWELGDLSVIAGFVASVALFGIAGLTFYGDSVRNRCVFLSDRGISKTLIWRTRLLPTTISFAIVIAILLLNRMLLNTVHHHRFRFDELFLALTLILVGYALCQLVSQWSPRPVFAFLAAPVFFFIGILIYSPLYDFYREGALLAAWASIPVLLFASWRLTPRWLSGSPGRDYSLRFVGYLMLAILLPYAMILSIRAATTPAEQLQWRKQMLAFELPEQSADAQRLEIFIPAESERQSLYSPWFLETFLGSPKSDDFDQRYAMELESEDSVGKYVSLGELAARMPSWPNGLHESRNVFGTSPLRIAQRDVELDSARLLLKWAAMVRNEARCGDASFLQLTRIAEQAEQIVAISLMGHVLEDEMTPELKELIGLFPDDDLVLESRRNSLIAAWQSYQRLSDRSASFMGTTRHRRFMLMPGLEDLRRDRFIDQTVRLAEQHWRSGSMKSVREIPNFVHSAVEADLFEPIGVLTNFNTREQIESLRRRVK